MLRAFHGKKEKLSRPLQEKLALQATSTARSKEGREGTFSRSLVDLLEEP